MNFKSESKGITLVALVITIIILLILAGITINSLTGSGLFDKVKLAKEESENAEKLENKTLGEYESEIGKYIDGTRNNFQSTIVYPGEGATESNPSIIGLSERIIIPNPYPGKKLYLVAQVCYNGIWSETGFVYVNGGYGVKASQRQGNGVDEIVIQSGKKFLLASPFDCGCGFSDEELENNNLTEAPYRVLVICLD